MRVKITKEDLIFEHRTALAGIYYGVFLTPTRRVGYISKVFRKDDVSDYTFGFDILDTYKGKRFFKLRKDAEAGFIIALNSNLNGLMKILEDFKIPRVAAKKVKNASK